MDQKAKISQAQRSILEKLIYAEPFEKVKQETGMDYGELRDELIQLINLGYVVALEKDSDAEASLHFYDSDNLELFAYKATSKGLSALNL